ncbi:4-hydroxy-tetrahydrodipicolinate synthase [Aurantiacibacter gangjinensis]|uniref:4-hydroxy-tetrahydrodipicolinate synthase n=1 Tax=Aurantiacibacter gangjinensis TaxID=502682 RepID=A0A0G9MPK7_9SPHN|nr:4-hydroxy-tetrahydrodipicolinate synthase [Aurantiacibacter gangjinensis]APE28399.1 4-hydroxy-tetrahydrodipicolinate synthase [Aurantiacibacter gangjinensis]KLE32625.1 dihydrodipicolinate synthase [Aurantiacibacter gangjinensis]
MFSGSIPALATPFAGTEVDEDAYRKFIEWQIENGSSGLVPCGTTGESATLDNDEHHKVIAICAEVANGRVPVIAGAGSNDTQTALWHIKEAQLAGADALLLVAPYYNRPSQEGLLAHFSYLAERAELPIVLYNVPGRTVTDIKPETVVELHRRFPEKIVALKDASGDLSRVVTQRMGAPELCQLSGDDPLVLAGYALGQVGCISVTANVAPRLCADFHAAAAEGDFETARTLNEKLYPLHAAMFADASPAPAKYALSKLFDWFSPDVRLPIAPCSDAAKAKVDEAMAGAGIG